MRYCKNCVLPDTRPNLVLNEAGICNACLTHGTKKEIDWTARETAFRVVLEHARKKSDGYDCLIPVSGGKDSTWQVVKCLEYGLHPLAVTWKSPGRTEIGRRNLENLVRLGVDHIDYQISPRVEKKFVWESFKKFGSTAIPMHMAIFNIPPKIAVRFGIPLIIWGENSAFEYGGPEEEKTGFRLDGVWLKRYGMTHGTTAESWISNQLSRRDLAGYVGPTESELDAAGINAIFLGYYFEWDPESTRRVAVEHGFQFQQGGARTGFYDFADIDDDFISVHHYLKWFKFGFTRTYDNLSLEIRNGRMSRDSAIEHLRRRGDEKPTADIEKLCAFLEIPTSQFYLACESFRNPNIWRRENDVWKIKDFLIPDWEWV